MGKVHTVFHHGVNVTWGDYLVEQSVNRTNDSLRDLRRQVSEHRSDTIQAMDRQTRDIVGSNEALTAVAEAGFGSLSASMDDVQASLGNIEYSLESLHADFISGIGLLYEQGQLIVKGLESIAKILARMDQRLATPTRTLAIEQRTIGLDLLGKGLWDKALESFVRSSEIYDTDYFVEYQIGLLRLEGIAADFDLIDLPEAKRRLIGAARYAVAESTEDDNAKRYAKQAHYYCTIAGVLLANEALKRGNEGDVQLELREALDHAERTVSLDADFAPGHYQVAKLLAILGRTEEVLPHVKEAIDHDPQFAIASLVDPDLESHAEEIKRVISDLHEDARQRCQQTLDSTRELLKLAGEWKASISAKLTRCVQEVERLLANDRYLDSRLAIVRMQNLDRAEIQKAIDHAQDRDAAELNRLVQAGRTAKKSLALRGETETEIACSLDAALEVANKAKDGKPAAVHGALSVLRSSVEVAEARMKRLRDAESVASRLADEERQSRERRQKSLIQNTNQAANAAMILVPVLSAALAMSWLGSLGPGMASDWFLVVPPSSILVGGLTAITIRSIGEPRAWKRFPWILFHCTIGPLMFLLGSILILVFGIVILFIIGLILMLFGVNVDLLFERLFYAAYLGVMIYAWHRCYKLQQDD